MKLKNLIRFRHIRVQKLSAIQIVMRICFLLGALCLIGALICGIYLEKDYKCSVRSGKESFPFTEYLTVEATDIPIHITRSADEQIHISYVSDTDVEIYEDNGRLVIEQVPSFVISLYTKSQFSYGIDIELPDKPFKSLNLNMASSKLDSCAVEGYMVNIRCKSGNVNIEKLSCTGTLDIESDSGSTEIFIDKFNSGRLTNTSGSVNLDFAEDTDIVISPGTRCYINGIAQTSDGRAANDSCLAVTSLSGRVRINTLKKEN